MSRFVFVFDIVLRSALPCIFFYRSGFRCWEEGGGADIDNGTRGSDGAEGGIADTGDSPPLTLNPNELQEATNEELMSMLRHQSARLQKLEEEYSRLKSKVFELKNNNSSYSSCV